MDTFTLEFLAYERLSYLGPILACLTMITLLTNLYKKNRWSLLVIRLSCLATLSTASLLPAFSTRSPLENEITVLTDISESMSDEAIQRSFREIKRILPSGSTLKIYPFAEKLSSVPENILNAKQIRRSWSNPLNSQKTDLNSIMEFTGKTHSVFLISDGYTLKPVREDVSIPYRLYPITVTIPEKADSDIELTLVESPVFSEPNTKIKPEATIKNNTEKTITTIYVLQQGDEKICQKEITLKARQLIKIPCDYDTPSNGTIRFSAQLDKVEKAVSYTTIISKKSLLLLSGTKKDEAFLKRILSDQYQQIESKTPPFNGIKKLSEYSTVILNNVSTNSLGTDLIRKLIISVKAGTGLFTIGGNRAFGLGKYHLSPLSSILPVRSLPPRKQKKRVNVAIALVLDKSNSMNQGQKIIYARRAANEVINNLKDNDYISVIGFDQNPFILIRMAQVKTIRSRASRIIQRLTGSKSSKLLPALDEARRGLTRVSAGRKHVIVLSDGAVGGSNDAYINTASRMSSLGITISSVIIGGDQALKLQNLAHYSGGKFYETSNVNSLPRIFLKDVEVSTGELTMKEQEEFSIRREKTSKRIVSQKSFPKLRGYVQTEPKSSAETELITGSLKTPHPLLAHFKVGDGKSVAFTSDLNGIWSNRLLSWSKIHVFIREIVEYSKSEKVDKAPLDLSLRHYIKDGELLLDVTVYDKLANDEIEAKLLSPSGKNTKFKLEKNKDGHYITPLDVEETGEYTLSLTNPGKAVTTTKIFVKRLPSQEVLSRDYNMELLSKLARLSGGEINPDTKKLNFNTKGEKTSTSLVPYLILISLLMMIFEVWLRETRP